MPGGARGKVCQAVVSDGEVSKGEVGRGEVYQMTVYTCSLSPGAASPWPRPVPSLTEVLGEYAPVHPRVMRVTRP